MNYLANYSVTQKKIACHKKLHIKNENMKKTQSLLCVFFMLQWFLALFIFDCANGIQRRQYQAQQQREEGKRSASDD